MTGDTYKLTPAGEAVAELLIENRRLQAVVNRLWVIVSRTIREETRDSDALRSMIAILDKNRTGGRKP